MSSGLKYLVLLLREEVAQSQAEVKSIRNSLRYRAGGLLVEVLSLSRHSLVALSDLFILFFRCARNYQTKNDVVAIEIPEAALVADVLVLTSSLVVEPSQGGTWVTNNANQLAAVMDAILTPRTLLIQQLDQVVLRRLARWQVLGGLVQWQPLPGCNYCPVLLGYLGSLLNKPLEPCL